MQVKLTTDTDYRKRLIEKKKASSVSTVTRDKSPFLEILEEILPSTESDSHDLNQLWAGLPDAEKDLIQNQSPRNLTAYRSLVKEIAARTIEMNVRINKVRKKGRRDDFELTTVHIIDDRLHKMAMVMQSPNNSAFSILKTLDEIRGLLLDLKK